MRDDARFEVCVDSAAGAMTAQDRRTLPRNR